MIKLSIPQGAQNESQLRLKGKGIQRKTSFYGDLFVKAKVEIQHN